jgi:protein required for attachment to host cells
MTQRVRIETGTWIVVADGEKALFLENEGDDKDYNFRVRRVEAQENPPAREQATDAPGRRSDGPQGHYSAMEPTDWHELEKERFAKDLADILYAQAHKGRYDRLILIAGPNVLGEMRPHLHKEVLNRLLGEIPKTLTNHQLDEVEKIVRVAYGPEPQTFTIR